MKATDEQLTSAARTVSLEASVNAARISPALLALDDAEGHLRAADGGGGSHGADRPDPTFAAVGKVDEAAKDRTRIARILTEQLNLSKELSGVLANWAPDEKQQAKLRGVNVTNDDMWCPNHLVHGMSEPRAQGRELCRFCDDFQRDYKHLAAGEPMLPNRWLLDTRSRRKLNAGDFAKTVADILAARRLARVEAKKAKSAG